MAQFKSSAKEGNFKDNQLEVPDEVRKLENAANRRLKGMSEAQAHLEKNRQIFLRAQEVSQRLTNTGAELASDLRNRNAQNELANSEAVWAAELNKDKVKAAEKAKTYKQLENFSKTAFNLTKGIIDNNQKNFLKAKNQIALTNGIDSDTLNKVSQLDREMTAAEYQRTDVVQQWLKEGKSQEFINTTYNHLLKGGGYTNYVENAFVLKNQGMKDSSALQEVIADSTLTPAEKKRKIAQIKSQLVANLTVNGQVPSAEFLAEHYFPALDRAEREAMRAINGEVRAEVEFENQTQRVRLLTNAYLGDGTTKNPQAALQVFSQNTPTKAKRLEAAQILINAGNLQDNIKLANTKFPGPNGTMVTLMDYPDTADLLNRAISKKEIERSQKFDNQKRLNQELMEEQIRLKLQEAYGDADSLTKSELQGIESWAFNEFGIDAGKSQVLEDAAKFTIEQLAIPEMEQALQEYVASGNATLSGLENFGTMPKSLKDRYTDLINKQTRIRNSSAYGAALKGFKDTIKGEINKYAKYVQGGYNSADVQWYAEKQTRLFIERVQRYSATTTDVNEAIRLAEQETVLAIQRELSANGAVSIKGGLKEYRDLLEQDENKIKQAQQKANELYGYKDDNGRQIPGFVESAKARTPEGWVEFYGEEAIIEASEQLQRGEQSPFFEQMGRAIRPANPMAPWEVQAWLAPKINGLEPAEPPASFEAIKERLTSQQRQQLFGNQAATQERIRILRDLIEDNTKPTRISFRSNNTRQGEWESLALQAGFNPEEARIMGAIVMAESGGDAAIDTVKSGLDPNKANEYSIGGPQINVAVHQDKLAARGFTEEDMRDPLKAMIIARDVYLSQGFGAWTTYNEGLHEAFFSQAPAQDGLVRHHRGGLTYIDNTESYRDAGNAFQNAGFRVAEHSDFDQVDGVHTEKSYHYHDEAFDITHQTGDYNESIAKTGRLQQLIDSLDLFVEVIGPLSGDPDHATHLHLGGLKRPMTAEDIRLIKSLK